MNELLILKMGKQLISITVSSSLQVMYENLMLNNQSIVWDLGLNLNRMKREKKILKIKHLNKHSLQNLNED
jgi:hypothetical protein